jgi:hypothetical protein
MRYRKLSASGDYVLGSGADFHVNVPEAVAQAATTRLGLHTGECFWATDDGTPWETDILGKNTAGRDAVLRARIVGTQGLKSLDSYDSQTDVNTRRFSAQASITTNYGTATLTL